MGSAPISEAEEISVNDNPIEAKKPEQEKAEAVIPTKPVEEIVNAPVQVNDTKLSNRYIVPESVYFATYIAISDNRLFDREWYQIEDIIKERGFADEVRDNVLNIIFLERKTYV